MAGLRDELRAKIFAAHERKFEIVKFMGAEIELRQPKLGDIISAREEENRQAAVIKTLVTYAYVPGTDERVFEEGDADALMELPFGQDFLNVNTAIEKLTDVNFTGGTPG